VTDVCDGVGTAHLSQGGGVPGRHVNQSLICVVKFFMIVVIDDRARDDLPRVAVLGRLAE